MKLRVGGEEKGHLFFFFSICQMSISSHWFLRSLPSVKHWAWQLWRARSGRGWAPSISTAVSAAEDAHEVHDTKATNAREPARAQRSAPAGPEEGFHSEMKGHSQVHGMKCLPGPPSAGLCDEFTTTRRTGSRCLKKDAYSCRLYRLYITVGQHISAFLPNSLDK